MSISQPLLSSPVPFMSTKVPDKCGLTSNILVLYAQGTWGRLGKTAEIFPRASPNSVILGHGGIMKEIIWDAKLPGFGLRTRNGKRT